MATGTDGLPEDWAQFVPRLATLLAELYDEDGVVDLVFYPANVEIDDLRPATVWCAESRVWEIKSGLGQPRSTADTAEVAAVELAHALRRRAARPDGIVVGGLSQRMRLKLARLAPELGQSHIDARERRREEIRRAPDMLGTAEEVLRELDELEADGRSEQPGHLTLVPPPDSGETSTPAEAEVPTAGVPVPATMAEFTPLAFG